MRETVPSSFQTRYVSTVGQRFSRGQSNIRETLGSSIAVAHPGRGRAAIATDRLDLIANVSHDLNTPLTALQGHLDILLAKEHSLEQATRQQYLQVAVRQCAQLGALIAQLYELAKLDDAGVKLRAEPVYLGELVQDVVQKFRIVAMSSGVRLSADTPHESIVVQADLRLLERVLDNLIKNALQHVTVAQEVRVALRAHAEHAVVQVLDTGAGIAPAELPFIFQRGYRGAGSGTSHPGGAGLGLAIAKRILELHDSAIAVRSAPATGTCFSFALKR